MIRLITILIILATGAYFAVNQIPSLKERVIEAVNPAAKERRLLGELSANLDEIEKKLEEAGREKEEAAAREKIKSSAALLEKSKGIMAEISKINEGAGIIGSRVGKVIDALFGGTPYPADHLRTASEPPIPACVCPPW